MRLTFSKFVYIYIFQTVFFIQIAYSQFNIKGKLQDQGTGEALSFASIKYNNRITTSDNNGIFHFTVNKKELHLEISYIGYFTFVKDYAINNKDLDLGTIYLKEDIKTLSEVTVTSGKYKKAIEDVTVSIETVKPAFLERNNTLSFDNLLEKIPGVNYIDGQANIRGGSGFSYGAGTRVLVLYDNIPALQFDSAYPNWGNIPVETIAKVEVMKGAGSSLYGSAAMNGVINILSIYAKRKPFLKIKTFASLYDFPADPVKRWSNSHGYKYGFSTVYAKKIKKLDLVSSLYFNNEPQSYKKDCYSQTARATLKLDYHLSDALNVGLHTNLNTGKKITFFYWKNSTTGAYVGDSLAYSLQNKKVYIFDPHVYYYTSNGGKHVFQSRIYYVSNDVSENKSNTSISAYGEYQYQKHFSNIGLILTTGTVHTIARTEAELYGDTVFIARNTGFYLQLEKKMWRKLNLVAGARYEINSVSGPSVIEGKDISDKYKSESKPIFRFGANYKLFPFTNLRASWGQGFRYPAIAEKFTNALSGNLLILPNPDLESETGYTAEIGIRQGYKFFSFKGFADLSVFQSEYNNMIEFNLRYKGRLFFTAENIGNTRIKGIEFSSGFTGNIAGVNISAMGGYLYIDPKYKDFNDEVKRNLSVDYNILKYRYKHSVRFDTEFKYKSFILGFGSFYNSYMEAVDKILEQEIFIKGVKQYRKDHMEGTNVYRMRLGFEYKKMELLFNIDNLFNKEYSVRPGLLQAPRSFTLSLGYQLK